jgi:predicted negative regulator of RcsB-dependent stress response
MRHVAEIRPRLPRWQVTAATTGVIIAGVAAAAVVWPHAWWWLVVAAAAAVVVVPAALAAAPLAWQRRREIGRATRGLQCTTGAGGRKLPTAETADLEARVHQTVLTIPYIHRDEEATIRGLLRAGRPVLLIGSSMVGKTKTAARVIAEEFGSWPVAIPESKTALAELDAKDLILHGSVIWLDDIDRLIGTGGITDGALRRLTTTGNVIIGTIRAREYDRFQPTDQLRPPEWDVLSFFERVFIARGLSDAELQRLAEAVHDPVIEERVRQVGLGEYAGAADRIAEALRFGESVSPVGFALVLGAADWRRAGMSTPVPARVLPDLAAPHLPTRHRADLSSDEGYQAALAWATRDINPTVALLQHSEPDAFMIYDYALDLLSEQARPIPDATWPILIRHANTDLLSIGFSAHAIGLSEVARQAWSKALDSGDADAAPRAAGYLGLFVDQEQGDLEGAKALYQEAIDSGHVNWAPIAADALGRLLTAERDVEGAKAAFQKAIDSGHYDQAPSAALGLAALLAAQGDLESAKAAYQEAIDSGHHSQAPSAAIRLGLLLTDYGDAEGAKAAFQKAIDSGYDAAALEGTLYLGDLLRQLEDVNGANAAYQKAIHSGHVDAAPRAAWGLGRVLRRNGDMEGAKAAYQKAIDSRHEIWAISAAHDLWYLLEHQGDAEGAEAARQLLIGLLPADSESDDTNREESGESRDSAL